MLHYKLVAGLGNPGQEYEMTRHNCGFASVDAIADALDVTYWKTQDGSLLAIAKLDGEELLLAKPQSFMNTSGGPISHLLKRYSIAPEQLLVIHDDMDIPQGDIRFKRGGGHGGHNGLRSITTSLKTDTYARLKVGIGRPPGKMNPADYVLQKLRKTQAEEFEFTTQKAAEAAVYAAKEGLDRAMLYYHTKG